MQYKRIDRCQKEVIVIPYAKQMGTVYIKFELHFIAENRGEEKLKQQDLLFIKETIVIKKYSTL